MMKEKDLNSVVLIVNCLLLHLCSSFVIAVSQQNTNGSSSVVPVKVGVVLDLGQTFGKIGLSCINMSLSDFYASHPHYNTRLILNVRDSNNDVVTAASSAVGLIKNEQVQAILGPTTSMQANFMISIGQKAHVPIITFSATSPSLTFLRSPYFFRITQNDSTQVNGIKSLVQAFGWKQVVPIYLDNEFGESVIPFLTNALQEAGIRIPYLSLISPSATFDQISHELYKLMTMQTRVFIVHMTPGFGSHLFKVAKQIGMMGQGYAWIVTNGIANGLSSLDQFELEAMQGVLGVKTHVSETKKLEDFKVRWRRKFLQENPTLVDAYLDVFGEWAYDATTALAMAFEKIGGSNFGFFRDSSNNLIDLETLGVSQNGENLRAELSSTRFQGISGQFNLVNGELEQTTFEIINIIGNGVKGVGFWTPNNGLMRNLSNSMNTFTYSTSKDNLGSIIWPGDTYSIPKGWEIPTNEKKFRIGVPVKDGFSEFVKVIDDTINNKSNVIGYCVDVFRAVVDMLPYALPHEFIPFAKPNGEKAGTYNDLTYEVYLGNFDAVVGDITIVSNRSKYVDFTLPFTESGVTMIVPYKDNKKRNAWVFLKPLTWDLWVTSACSFVFIGFVVWVLEHRINEDFRGPPFHQIGTSCWFSFSTMVFAHRERVVSNLSRFVVIVWVFVVLILTQSYTASLTSLLTVEQLRPTVTDVNELIRNRLNVGYQEGSFVYGILKGLGFQDSQLQTYDSPEGCDELFNKGSANGGISAAFDEIPYMRLLLATYCSKYTMVEPTFKTDGFGFVNLLQVFPIGSPLVPDISRAILNVTQGEEMKRIEDKWFKKQNKCPNIHTSISSNSLDLNSFWGLFLIAGIASVLALLIFTTRFLYEQRHILLRYNASVWTRIRLLSKLFDQKDLSSHTFKKSEVPNQRNDRDVGIPGLSVVVETPPTPSTHSHCPPSPSSHTPSHFFIHEMPSPNYDDFINAPHGQVASDRDIEAPIELTSIPLEPSTLSNN